MNAPSPPQKLLSIFLMARRLRVPIPWLRAEAEGGRLPCLRAGKTLLFNAEAVERVLLERARELPDPGGPDAA
jgi:hypothetical protein